jgi:trehalose 6-phosphate phosphatase
VLDSLLPTLTDDQALFLDFDGTLVDIAPRPDGIVLDPMLRAALSRLSGRLLGALAIVSGRPIADIDRWLAPLVLPCAGVHGAERRGASSRSAAQPLPELEAVARELQAFAAARTGLAVERKSVSVALHYRLAPELEADCRDAVVQALQQAPGLRLLHGKRVLEVLPRTVGKGHAIEAFLQEPPFAGRRPMFVGDDITDEAGFELVQRRGGVAVKVGAGESRAACRIDSPGAVRRWLFAAAELEP